MQVLNIIIISTRRRADGNSCIPYVVPIRISFVVAACEVLVDFRQRELSPSGPFTASRANLLCLGDFWFVSDRVSVTQEHHYPTRLPFSFSNASVNTENPCFGRMHAYSSRPVFIPFDFSRLEKWVKKKSMQCLPWIWWWRDCPIYLHYLSKRYLIKSCYEYICMCATMQILILESV